ncbi:MAG: 3-oxoacyl-ACP synthase III family protein [Candidatus Aminicenantes bacterium]|nr:3-oxoacyl-ACP synthase III family protein [Candidatus Aminicenantes bacterium]MDH5706589.1 3-oxoacyl-ACP synthase III family protein [Candidatus Aminicenantes bacterium]
MPVSIVGVGKCLPGVDLPGRVVTNEEIIEILLANKAIKPGTDKPWGPEELTPQRIEDLIGVKERHWAARDQNTSDLALVAAEAALQDAQIGWEDVGMLIVGTSSPESFYPSTACLVLNKIAKRKIVSGVWTEREAKEKLRIQASDVLAACTSSIYAIDIVKNSLLQGDNEYEYGLAVGAEVMSRVLDFSDTNADLWGDGAGAVVLKRTNSKAGIIWTSLGSDSWGAELAYSRGMGTSSHYINTSPNVFIKGHEVQKFVLKIMCELITKTIEQANSSPGRYKKIKLDDISLFICHQANSRIFDFPAKKLKIPIEKFYINVDRRGNTSSASVLIALCEALDEGRIKEGDLIMFISFGGGLTWASMLVEWEKR